MALVGGVVWQSVAGSEGGPVRNPPPPNPLDKVEDPALREALTLSFDRGTYSDRLDCDPSEIRFSPFTGPIIDRFVPPPGMATVPLPPPPPRRYLPGWHEVARTPEEAAENLTLSEQFEKAGTVAGQLVYVVGERSNEAGIANVYGTLPDGRRVRVTHVERKEDGSWAPPNAMLMAHGKPATDFATHDEYMAYVPDYDPDAIWTWVFTSGGSYCDGLRDPVPAP